MNQSKVCILGGCGFVGRRIASTLANRGIRVAALTRHRERNRDMLVRPEVSVVECDVFDPGQLTSAVNGVDAVINLVGILNSGRQRNQTFQRAHVDLSEVVLEAMAWSGVRRLLHMSAANASADGPSEYLKTKGAAENLLKMRSMRGEFDVTVFRPSVIFGPGDSFTNRFAQLLRRIPLAFPLACPESRLQPIHVDDVATCFADALNNPRTVGEAYDLCGPRSYTLYELVTMIAAAIGVRRKIVKLSHRQSELQAKVMQYFPGKPFTPDNFKSLQVDSVCSGPFPTVFGIQPRSMEDTLSAYLGA
jgi:NADH dehydrogenase